MGGNWHNMMWCVTVSRGKRSDICCDGVSSSFFFSFSFFFLFVGGGCCSRLKKKKEGKKYFAILIDGGCNNDMNHTSTNGAGSPDFPTLTEAATIILTPAELQNLRRNLTEEKIAHAKYLREHPEIDVTLRRAMRKLLMERPQDPVSVLLEYFAFADLHAALDADDREAEKRAERVHQRRGLVGKWPP